ncbi:CUB domain-containing protein [Caerostris extrusa]|uniref:CUB domain-containing protein n=1 Tax=Caerostris extrusa TaxID=172846 RepID=A0AAV4PB06_CAEEX|nr:CUB domain-containing protein [Caerostris extrusa]
MRQTFFDQLWCYANNCQIEKSLSGTISHSGFSDSNGKCWKIPAIAGKFIRIQINNINSEYSCEEAFVNISVPETSEEYKLCPGDSNAIPIVSLRSVIVKPYKSYRWHELSFSLSFIIKDIECINKNSFRCDNNSCVPASKVCDGVKDCSNGADEVGCETGILAIKGIEEARQNAISWLKKKRSASWGMARLHLKGCRSSVLGFRCKLQRDDTRRRTNGKTN